jgi:hypothetical protein
MWLFEHELQAIGFRPRAGRYWQCEGRYGLPPHGYLSLFISGKHTDAGRSRPPAGQRVELSTFHVTFQLDVDRIHFYYHEMGEGVWEPGGHTSWLEIERHRFQPRQLRRQTDQIAGSLITALGGVLAPRE